jgi:hypothetical protein
MAGPGVRIFRTGYVKEYVLYRGTRVEVPMNVLLRISILTATVLALVAPASARHRSGGVRVGVSIGTGRFGGGFRGGHFSGGFRRGGYFGGPFSRSCYLPRYSYGYPGYSYLSYPAYQPFPDLYLGSPFYFGSYGSPYYDAVSYGYSRPAVVELPPRVIYLPSARDEERRELRRDEAGGQGRTFYLEPRKRDGREGDRGSVLALARRRLRVTPSGRGRYELEWMESAERVASVEFQAVDDRGDMLHYHLLREAPFRGLLLVPHDTAAVVLFVEYQDGRTISVKLPVREVKALADE